jgi:hypothetical protein
VTAYVVDHDMGNRISYLISFFFVLLIFLTIFALKFNQVLDVMLQTHSSHRGEAASSPHPRRTTLKNANTNRAFQLHAVNAVTETIQGPFLSGESLVGGGFTIDRRWRCI